MEGVATPRESKLEIREEVPREDCVKEDVMKEEEWLMVGEIFWSGSVISLISLFRQENPQKMFR